MTLTDAGPLVALIDADEADHELCRAALGQLELPLATTWPAFTEAMYLLGRAGGSAGREALWRLVLSERLHVLDLSRPAIERSAKLMAKYADLPMDLADATLVAVAEERHNRRVFTLDSDFQIYRLNGRQRFDVVPAPRR
ncbi:MAG: type II toxin-antitoxin system VapC family toxin [Solirubrobacteraceae bacterium]